MATIVLNMLALYFFGSPLELTGARAGFSEILVCMAALPRVCAWCWRLGGGRALRSSSPTLGARGILGLLVHSGYFNPNQPFCSCS